MIQVGRAGREACRAQVGFGVVSSRKQGRSPCAERSIEKCVSYKGVL